RPGLLRQRRPRDHFVNAGAAWAAIDGVEYRLQGFGRPDQHGLDLAIAQVAHPAGDAGSFCALPDEVSKADTLDPASDEDVDAVARLLRTHSQSLLDGAAGGRGPR